MREVRARVRWYIQDVRPSRYPTAEALLLGMLGMGLWATRTALVILLGGGPM